MNLDHLLGKALRGGITSNYVIDLQKLFIRYENGDYSNIIIELQNTNISDWNGDIAILFLKCYIHIYDENDDVIKDLLVLSFLKMNTIEFSGLGIFHINFSSQEMSSLFLTNTVIKDWQSCIVTKEGNFSFLFENVERFKKDFTIKNSTRDHIGLFILSCFELYDMNNDSYPLFKWLFNIHFTSKH